MKKLHKDQLAANKDVLLEKFNAVLKECELEHLAIKEIKFEEHIPGIKRNCTWVNVGGILRCI